MGSLPKNKYISIKDAAEYLGVSTKTLRRWEASGVLKSLRTKGGHRRYSQSEISEITSKKQNNKNKIFAKDIVNAIEQKAAVEKTYNLPQIQQAYEVPAPEVYQPFKLHNEQTKALKIISFAFLAFLFLLFVLKASDSLLSKYNEGKKILGSYANLIPAPPLVKLITSASTESFPKETTAIAGAENNSQVLAATTSSDVPVFNVNIRSSFKEVADFVKGLTSSDVATGTLEATGAATFGSTVNIAGATTIEGPLTENGQATFTKNVDIAGDLTSPSTTFNLLNTNVTTLNIGKASTTTSISSTTGTTTINNDLVAKGLLNVTGKITGSGDLSIAGASVLSGALSVSGATTLSSTLDVTGNSTFGNITKINGVTYSFPTAQGAASSTLTNDGSGTLTWTSAGSSISGTGTTNTIPKFTSASAIGNSLLTDNGSTLSYNGTFNVTSAGAVTITGTTNINTSGSSTTTIGAVSGTDLALNDAQWNITGLGAANFTSVGAGTAGTGAFTTLSGSSTITFSGLASGTPTNGICIDSSNHIITCTQATGTVTQSGSSLANDVAYFTTDTNITGNGIYKFNPGATTGTGTSSNLSLADTTLTSGTNLYLSSNHITTGKLLDIADSGNTWTGNGTTNGLVNFASSSTAAAGSATNILLNLSRSGTNTNSAATSYGVYSNVTNIGTTSVNGGGYFNATGGVTNYDLNLGAISTANTLNAAINIGDVTGAGTNKYVASTNWNVTGAGAETLASDLGVNGSNITTTNTGTFALLNTNATTLNFGGAATTMNIGPAGSSGTIAFSGGSADTGCTEDGTTGNFTCSGNIVGSSSGSVGFWSRSGTTLSPTTANDIASITSNSATALLTLSPTGATGTGLAIGALSGATANKGISIGNITAAATANNFGISTGTITPQASATTYGINLGNTLAGAGTATYGINIGTNASTATTNYGMFVGSLSGAGTTNYGEYIDNLSGATTSKGLLIGTNSSATATGIDIGAMSGSTANTGVTIGGISGTGTASAINTGTISSTGATAQQINLGTITGANATSHSALTAGAISGTTATATGITLGTLTGGTSTNAQLNLGGITTTGATNSYGVNVGALSGTGTNNYGVNIAALTSTGTSSSGINIAGLSGAATNNYGINIGSITGGGTGNYGILFNNAPASGSIAAAINTNLGLTTTGTGSQIFSSGVTTGTTTSGAFVFTGNSLTSGTGMYVDSSSITTGDLMAINSTGTTLTTGNLLNVENNSASVFSVSGTQITNALPTQFTSAGDVSVAYDLQFTNPVSSFVKSTAPLYLAAGETFNSSNLTLRTYNLGNILLDSGSSSTGTGKVGIGPNVTPIGLLHVSNTNENTAGLTGKAVAIFDQGESQDIISASAAGVTKFTVSSAGAGTFSSFLTANVAGVSGAAAGNIWYDTSAGKFKINEVSGGTKTLCNNVDLGCGTTTEQKFTANGSYTVVASAKMLIVAGVGSGGGGSGGVGGANGTIWSGGGAGGGGAFDSGTFLASLVSTPVTVTIDAGGAGGTGTTGGSITSINGSAGGSTTFGSVFTLFGGGGGAASASVGGGGGGGGGSSQAGQTNGTPQSGGSGGQIAGGAASGSVDGAGGGGGGTAAAAGGTGGASYYGGGGGMASSSTGAAETAAGGGSIFGAGGGGAGGSCAASCTARSGGNGGGLGVSGGGGNGLSGNGNAGADGNENIAGTGGGGGGSVVSGTGGNGGNGGAVGGGGGGGGAASGSGTGGNGGKGGRGELHIWAVQNGGADLAEIYATNDDILNVADVVELDPSLKAGVKKSQGAYSSTLLGVVSTQPASLIGQLDDPGKRALPIALAGRVPVKVNTENGPIMPGDYLTSSSTPGVAMKATKAGQVIGQAMGEFDGNAIGMGVLTMFVNNQFHMGNLTAEGYFDTGSNFKTNDIKVNVNNTTFASLTNSTKVATDSSALTDKSSATDSASISLSEAITKISQRLDKLEGDTALLSAGGIASSSGTFSASDSASLANLTVLKNAILPDTVVNGKLNVGTLVLDNTNNSINSIGTLKLQSLGLGNIDFMNGLASLDTNGNFVVKSVTADKYKVAGTSAGTDKILAGQTSVTINTSQVTDNSLVFVTPQTLTTKVLSVTTKSSGSSFKVEISSPENKDIQFNWWIVDKQ